MDGKTHAAQILHNVEEVPPPLIREAHPDNRLLIHQIPRDLRPRLHSRLPTPRRPPPLNMHAQPIPTLPRPRQRRRRGSRSRGRRLRLGAELRPPHAAVPLPRRLERPAPRAVHGHALRAGRHVDDLPVARGPVVSLAVAAPRVDRASEVLCLLARRVAEGGRGVGAPAGMVVVDAEEVVVVVVLVAAVARGGAPRGGAPDDVYLGLVRGGVDVDLGVAVAGAGLCARLGLGRGLRAGLAGPDDAWVSVSTVAPVGCPSDGGRSRHKGFRGTYRGRCQCSA